MDHSLHSLVNTTQEEQKNFKIKLNIDKDKQIITSIVLGVIASIINIFTIIIKDYSSLNASVYTYIGSLILQILGGLLVFKEDTIELDKNKLAPIIIFILSVISEFIIIFSYNKNIISDFCWILSIIFQIGFNIWWHIINKD
tara:strand:- start:104 stop:529 length:426 start_codon:yes stop_codon:yes gene_type:complete